MTVFLELTRIVQAVAEADAVADQVSVVVNSVQEFMGVDVCSLYLVNKQGEMALVASRGLDAGAVGAVRIPAGKGLTGLVAQLRHPVNIADAAAHPAFYYTAATREDQFSSFFGVPLVRAGQVLGVLVVQSRRAHTLSEEESAFLVTLASQLALVVVTDAIWQALDGASIRTLSGLKGAPGVGIGRASLCDEVDIYSVMDGPCEDVSAALCDWQALVAKVHADVRDEQLCLGSKLSKDVSAIFDAYQLLLSDPSLVNGVAAAISEGHHLPGALRRVIHHHAELFLAMEDPYLRARHEDIRHPVVDCEAPVLDQRMVRDSGGHQELPYVIATTIKIGEDLLTSEVTLTDRDTMKFRVLLGRTVLRTGFLVNSRKSYLSGRRARN